MRESTRSTYSKTETKLQNSLHWKQRSNRDLRRDPTRHVTYYKLKRFKHLSLAQNSNFYAMRHSDGRILANSVVPFFLESLFWHFRRHVYREFRVEGHRVHSTCSTLHHLRRENLLLLSPMRSYFDIISVMCWLIRKCTLVAELKFVATGGHKIFLTPV